MMEAPEQDHYDILQVSLTADTKEIKSAARKLYLRYHPDKGGNSQKFCEVRLAEEILTCLADRHKFDSNYTSLREAWRTYQAAREEWRRDEDESFRRKEREAAYRTQEAVRKAQEVQESAARERLHKLQEDEQRFKRMEEDRIKAQEEEERLRKARDHRLQLEREAEVRTEASAARRRRELQDQAMRRLREQDIDRKLQDQRCIWSQFRLPTQADTRHSSPAPNLVSHEITCNHELWAKRTGRGTCNKCGRANLKAVMMCLSCQTINCYSCRSHF